LASGLAFDPLLLGLQPLYMILVGIKRGEITSCGSNSFCLLAPVGYASNLTTSG